MTQLVYPFTLVPGQPENVNQLNDNLGAIQNVLNGNIGSDNIADGGVDFNELSPQIQTGYADNLQAGVVGATDGKVTYASAAGVSIAAGSAWVSNASGLLRRVTWNANALTVPVSTGTRLDQIVIDSTGTLSRVAGTEQAAGVATLTNRTGAAALPTGMMRLADLLITTAGVVNDLTNNIRDRRPWARGARGLWIATANSGGTNDIVFNNATFLTMDAASGRTSLRLECSGAPVMWRVAGVVNVVTAGVNGMSMRPHVDGGAVDGMTDTSFSSPRVTSVGDNDFDFTYPIQTLAAGSHLFQVGAAGAFTLYARPASFRFILEVWEDLRPAANNGTA